MTKRVLDQVHQDLFHQHGIQRHPGQVLGDIHDQRLLSHPRLEVGHRRAHDIPQRLPILLDRQRAAFEAGDFEEVRHEPGEMFRLLHDGRDHVALLVPGKGIP